jgi:hypothetical protein
MVIVSRTLTSSLTSVVSTFAGISRFDSPIFWLSPCSDA